MYPEEMVQPMRAEVTRLGIAECRNGADIDKALSTKGTVLAFINSVCGCAAGNARPGLALAMSHGTKPTAAITVFAGNDPEAAARLRSKMAMIPPSSPFFALFKDGQVVHAVPRHEIEGKSPQDVARNLTTAFDKHCSATASA